MIKLYALFCSDEDSIDTESRSASVEKNVRPHSKYIMKSYLFTFISKWLTSIFTYVYKFCSGRMYVIRTKYILIAVLFFIVMVSVENYTP